MSALDQAFIKAYASAPVTMHPAPPPVEPAPAGPSALPLESPPQAFSQANPMIDQLYADGTLYRLDAAAEGPVASAIPAPHFQPTSLGGRRTARRMARQAAVEAAAQTDPTSFESLSQPVPRAPQRRPHSRDVLEIARRLAQGTVADEESELTPEILIQPPTKPATSPLPEASPLDWPPQTPVNVVVQPNWNIAGEQWPTTPLTLFPASPEWLAAAAAASVEVDLEAMPAESDRQVRRERKSFRIDSAHAPTERAPHRGLGKKSDESTTEPTPAGDEAIVPTAAIKQTSLPAEPPRPAHVDEVASASTPQTTEPAVAVAEVPPATIVEPSKPESILHKKPCVPVWEVDHFLWPETCDKLLSDSHSYFQEAGQKLLAARQDGLKSLAVTGSRRGEGRSTVALSLARCAAKAGLSVAVVDADFARPQLAEMIGLEVSHGWQDAALGKIPLSEAAIKSLEDKVTVLPL
jgi:hypothetical protein